MLKSLLGQRRPEIMSKETSVEPYTVNFTQAKVRDLLDLVNDTAFEFNELLGEPSPRYYTDWLSFYQRSTQVIKKAGNTWKTAAHLFPSSPDSWHDYVEAVLRLVPPVQAVLKLEKSTPTKVTLLQYSLTEVLVAAQELHASETGSRDDTSISSDIKKQVEDFTTAFQASFDEFKASFADTITTQVQTAIQDPKNEENIKNFQMETAKLTAAIDSSKDQIAALYDVSQSLQTQASEATDSSEKIYSNLASKVHELTTQSVSDIEEAIEKGPNEQNESENPAYADKPFYLRPDEYLIKGTKISIRPKKFIEDETVIDCDSADDILTMYDHFRSIASQYGIMTTDSQDIGLWRDPDLEPIPTTFPFRSDDFESKEHGMQAYNTMSHAIATKLIGKVNFGEDFHAVQFIVHKHEKDGFRLLYNLLKVSHPRLTHNKAVRPERPKFEGDLPKLVSKYKNFLSYEMQRDSPRMYELDEQAEDILLAIKLSPWYEKIKDGVKEADEKLQMFKNHRFDRGLSSFPHELKINFISQTIMQYYIDRNLNPLLSPQKSGNDERTDKSDAGQDRVRRGYYSRSRSTDRFSNRRTNRRSDNRSRSPFPRDNSQTRDRSTDTRPLQDCNICNGTHRSDTIGCPHFLKHYHVNQFLKSNSHEYIRNTAERMERQRSRSRSIDSRRSSTTDASARSVEVPPES